MMHENCRGCSSLTLDIKKKLQVCITLDAGLINSCPCQVCLVKAVCNEACDDYNAVYMKLQRSYQLQIEQLLRVNVRQ